MKPGDLIRFNKPPVLTGWSWKEYVDTVAIVLNSEMKPVFPSDPHSDMYECITLYSPSLERVAMGPSGNWDLVNGENELVLEEKK